MATQQFKTQTGVSLQSNNNYLEDQWAGLEVHFVHQPILLTVTTISDGSLFTTSANHGLSVNDVVISYNTINGLVVDNTYFVQSTPNLNTFTLTDIYNGSVLTTFDNGTELTIDITCGTPDYIDNLVSIFRGFHRGIYNPILDTQWDDNFTPSNTAWNADGWGDLHDVTNRTYVTYYQVNGNGGLGHNAVGTEFVMHDTENDKYYTLKFLAWQAGAYGGAFSYVRREINTDVFFVHTNNGDEVDYIYTDNANSENNVAITRDTQNGIYNPDVEGSYQDDISPGNTLWNTEGWDDLTDIESRQYLSWYSAVKGQAGKVITGLQFVMKAIIHHDGADDTYEYYTVDFHNWSVNNGGGFSYTRKKINTKNPPSVFKFSDGTIQSTAVTPQRLGVIPQSANTQDNNDYYITLRDIGQHVILNYNCSVYIPDAEAVNIPIGSVITLINMSGAEVSVYKDNNNEDGVIYNGAGNGSSNNGWGLNSQGIFTLLKLRTYYDGYPITDWMISGPNLDNYC